MNKIDEFLVGQDNPNTKKNYRSRLTIYFKTIKADPETYFDEGRDYNQDMLTFLGGINGFKGVSKKLMLNTVKAFLDENEVVLSKKVKKLLKAKIKRSKPATLDIVPSPKELKEILQHGETKARALFLLLSSSGMRVNEALSLTKEDIDFDYDPPKIYIRGETTKMSQSRIAFMSYEAKEVILAWMKEREDYLKQAVKKSIKHKSMKDDTIFPFCYKTAENVWRRLLIKSGYDDKDKSSGWYRRHIHTLRKYFRIYSSPKATKDVSELLMGHADSLGDVYREHYPESKLAEMYKKAMPDLSVYSVSSDESIKRLDEELQQKDKEIHELKQQLDDINKRLDKGVGAYLFEEMQKIKKQNKK